MLNIKLDQWQQDVLKSPKNIAVRSGRQCGKSTTISLLAGEYAAKNSNKTIMIIASVERQAYLLFEKVLSFMEQNYPRMIKKGRQNQTKSKLALINGSVIHCLPTGLTGYGIRGFTIDLLIADEAAFIPEEVFAAVTPALATRISKGARIILLSTPFGRQGYFARAFTDPSFETFHVSSEECERIDKDFLKQEKARMTKRQYMQEYMGEFVDELMQFFPDELIRTCMRAQREPPIKDVNYYMGVDLARMGDDESTFSILKLTNDTKRFIQVEQQITKRTYLSDSTKHIIGLQKIWDFQKIFLDDEGIGVGVYDHLLDNDDTKRVIVGINNSKRVTSPDKTQRTRLLKEDLYNNLLGLMERGEIDFLEDPEIFQSFKSVQFDYTSDSLGKPHLKIFGNYTHLVESLIRAAWAIKYKDLNISVFSIKV